MYYEIIFEGRRCWRSAKWSRNTEVQLGMDLNRSYSTHRLQRISERPCRSIVTTASAGGCGFASNIVVAHIAQRGHAFDSAWKFEQIQLLGNHTWPMPYATSTMHHMLSDLSQPCSFPTSAAA